MRNWLLLSGILIVVSGAGSRAAIAGSHRAAPSPKTRTSASSTSGMTGPLDLRGLLLRVPASWHRQPSTTPFRLAQYAIPHAPGDTAPASFIIFYFGPGQGGSAEANIQRWIGMMRQPNGKDSHAVAHRGQIQRPGLRISTLDVTGTYMESPNPFTTETIPRPHSRMLAAVSEPAKPNNAGSFFLRLVGPARTVGAAKPGWDAMLASVRAK